MLAKAAPLALILSTVLLSGCASSSPIQRYRDSKSAFSKGPELMTHNVPDDDIYRIYQRASTGFTSIQTIRETVEKRASNFCEKQGKTMLILGEKISQPPYILGNFPRIEIVFACVDKPQHPAFEDPTYEKLTNLKKLLDSGVITRDEFEREKRKILNSQ